MTVDRLEALRAAQRDDDDSEMDEVALNMELEPRNGFMDKFFADVEELLGLLTRVENDTEELKKVHSAILCTPGKDEKLQRQLDALTEAIRTALNQIRQRLQVIGQSIEHAQEFGESPADLRIRKTQHATLSRRLVELMTENNRAQMDYRKRCTDRVKRANEIGGQDLTDEDIERLLETGNISGLTQNILMVDEQQARQTLEDIAARYEDIVKLETSITELHDMFVDMAVLVESQGEMIDRIEYQVDHAVEYVDRANTDMKTAREYESKARKKKMMIMACVLVAGGIGLSILAGTLGF